MANDPMAGDAGEGDDGRARPQTRKELNELKANFTNNLHLACHFHQDPTLALEFKAMYFAARPLLREYQNNLEIQSQGQDRWESLN